MCIGGSVEIALKPAPDRRIHERLKATDVKWLRGARLKYGAEVRVLNISVGGLLLETENELKPNAMVVLELIGPDSPIPIPAQVVRRRAVSLGTSITYEAACAFKRPLTIPELTATVVAHAAPLAECVSSPAEPRVGWQKVVARLKRWTCGLRLYERLPSIHDAYASVFESATV